MTPEQFKALRTAEDNLTAVLCDPEGKCCIIGHDADRRIIDDALDIIRTLAAEPAPELTVEQFDAAWTSFLSDEQYAEIRKVLSAHQIRTMFNGFARAVLAAAQEQKP